MGVSSQTETQNTKKLSRQEKKEMEAKRQEEKKEMEAKRQEQMKKEINGYIDAKPNVNCLLQSGTYQVAVLPFDVNGSDESSKTHAGKILRDHFETHLSQLGWTVIGKERTEKYLSSLQKLVERNVLEEEEIRNIKEMVGADVFVTGSVTEYHKGTSGSSGTEVNFSVKCQLIETSCREVWGCIVNSFSGAYNYDTSPSIRLNEAMKQFFENLKTEIANCNKNEKE
jgi:hypothetical protein